MDEPRDKSKTGQPHQRDWASQRQTPGQQQRQRGGSGRQDIDDSDQAVGGQPGVSDESGMLDEGGEPKERRPDREI